MTPDHTAPVSTEDRATIRDRYDCVVSGHVFGIDWTTPLTDGLLRVLLDALAITDGIGSRVPDTRMLAAVLETRPGRLFLSDGFERDFNEHCRHRRRALQLQWPVSMQSVRSLYPSRFGRWRSAEEADVARALEHAEILANKEGRNGKVLASDFYVALLRGDNELAKWVRNARWINSKGRRNVQWSLPEAWVHKICSDAPSLYAASLEDDFADWDVGSTGATVPPPATGEGAAVPVAGHGAPTDRYRPDELWQEMASSFPWMREANVRLCRDVAGVASGNWPRVRPLLLVGDIGSGKTHWCKAAAAALGHHVVRHSLGGATSGAMVSGFEKTWKNSEPSLVTKAIREAGNAFPMIVMDEIDKAVDSTSGGSIHDALLPLLNNGTAGDYRDTHENKVVDASGIVWAFTANSLSALPRAFLDRVTVLHVRKPTVAEAEPVFRKMHAAAAAGEDTLEDDLSAMRAAFVRDGSLRAAEDALVDAVGTRLWSPPGLPKAPSLSLVG